MVMTYQGVVQRTRVLESGPLCLYLSVWLQAKCLTLMVLGQRYDRDVMDAGQGKGALTWRFSLDSE